MTYIPYSTIQSQPKRTKWQRFLRLLRRTFIDIPVKVIVAVGIALGAVAAILGLILLVASVVGAAGGWLVMLLLGALHSQWPAVPALGFWICFLAVSVLTILANLVSRGSGGANNITPARRVTFRREW